MATDTRYTTKEEVEKLKTLPEFVTHHLPKRGDFPAFSDYDSKNAGWRTVTFSQLNAQANRWAKAFAKLGLKKGDRVACLLPNSIAAVEFDQGALKGGLVPVPLHIIDTPANCAYILGDSGAKVLVTMNGARWHAIEKAAAPGELDAIEAVIYIDDEPEESEKPKVMNVEKWLADADGFNASLEKPGEDDLACLVYTSGTTGKPKGVMLTHKNLASDVKAVIENICPLGEDVWLSFLPMSHMFERSTSYYTALAMGNHVYFNRGIPKLVEDLKTVQPTLFMSVPRIYEKVYAKIQERLKTKGKISQFIFREAVNSGWRNFRIANGLAPEPDNPPRFWDTLLDPLFNKLVRQQIQSQFGGRLRVAVSGGASLNVEVAKTFFGLGIEIFQGYGMTETSPILSVNKIGHNDPSTVGPLLKGVEWRLGDKDELQVRGPMVMKGYWKRPEDTKAVLTDDGWLSTGDVAEATPTGSIRIKGRIKEIIVTSNGEKIAPVDVEQAIETDPLFAQSMVIGEGHPFVVALAVLDEKEWHKLARELKVDPNDPASLKDKKVRQTVLRRIKKACSQLPQYGVPRNVGLQLKSWTIEDNMLTPTMKIKRRIVTAKFKDQIEDLYTNFGK